MNAIGWLTMQVIGAATLGLAVGVGLVTAAIAVGMRMTDRVRKARGEGA